MARMAPIPPAMQALTPRPLTRARKDSRTQAGKFQASRTNLSHATCVRRLCFDLRGPPLGSGRWPRC
eukprot:4533140-Heterocapsa_arctica.AAC.1